MGCRLPSSFCTSHTRPTVEWLSSAHAGQAVDNFLSKVALHGNGEELLLLPEVEYCFEECELVQPSAEFVMH